MTPIAEIVLHLISNSNIEEDDEKSPLLTGRIAE